MIYAMFALSMLTIFVGLIAVKARITAVKTGQVSLSYFELMQGKAVPETIIKTSRCFINLFEIPTLFYVVCTLYIVLEIDSTAAIVVAWLFVLFRCVQAGIHITYNQVRHRMYAFGGSVLCVFILWLNLIILLP